MQTLRVIGSTSYILLILKLFPIVKTLTGMVYFPPGKQEHKPVCLFEFRVDPLNW